MRILTDAVELTWSLLAAPAASKLAAAVTPASSVAIVCFPKSPFYRQKTAQGVFEDRGKSEGRTSARSVLMV